MILVVYLPNYFKLQSGPDCGAADCGRGRFGIKSLALVLHTANCCLSTGNLVQICEAGGFTLVLIVEQSIAVQIVEQSIVVQIVEQSIVVQIVEQGGKGEQRQMPAISCHCFSHHCYCHCDADDYYQ